MKRRVFKNKKGFTLVELIVTIAIMAILAAAVTPAVYVTTKRRQKSAAETDTQTMYRNAIAAVTYLSGQYIYPNKIDSRDDTAVNNVKNGWYVTYSAMVCKRIYQTVIGLDIPVKYYDPGASGKQVLVPDGCNEVKRSSFVSADNKNPYIVIQVVGVTAAENSDEIVYYLIVSYHNDKNQFAAWDGGAAVQTATLDYVTKDPTTNPQLNRAYQTNKGTPIRYTFKIRTK